MTIRSFADQLRQALNKKLKRFVPETDDLLKVGNVLNIARDSLRELKTFVNDYRFDSAQEEITFFKEIKPSFLGQYFFYKKLFALRVFDSFRDVKAQHENYYNELKKLEKYAARHKEFYEYCVRGASDLDHVYFLRGRKDHDSVDRDEKFSTGFDAQLARIQANEMIRVHILGRLEAQALNLRTSDLHWTASKAALIELVYALHAAKAFNHGSADIRPIAAALESCFNISLGNYYRVFQDIRLRKGSVTTFLDQLRENLRHHIDTVDG